MRKVRVDYRCIAFATMVSGLVPIGVKAQTASSTTGDVITIAVPDAVLEAASGFGPGAIFYTSRTEPLQSLTEITDPETQVGMVVANYFPTITRLLRSAGAPADVAGGPFRQIGGAYFAELFTNNPDLRFFVARRSDDEFHTTIATSGGGVELRFIAN